MDRMNRTKYVVTKRYNMIFIYINSGVLSITISYAMIPTCGGEIYVQDRKHLGTFRVEAL